MSTNTFSQGDKVRITFPTNSTFHGSEGLVLERDRNTNASLTRVVITKSEGGYWSEGTITQINTHNLIKLTDNGHILPEDGLYEFSLKRDTTDENFWRIVNGKVREGSLSDLKESIHGGYVVSDDWRDEVFSGKSIFTIPKLMASEPEIADGTYWVTSNDQPNRHWWEVVVRNGTADWLIRGSKDKALAGYVHLVNVKNGNTDNSFHTVKPKFLTPEIANGTYWVTAKAINLWWRVEVEDQEATWYINGGETKAHTGYDYLVEIKQGKGKQIHQFHTTNPRPEIADGTYWVTDKDTPVARWWEVVVKGETAEWYIRGTEKAAIMADYQTLVDTKNNQAHNLTFHSEKPEILNPKPEIADGTYWVNSKSDVGNMRVWTVEVKDGVATWTSPQGNVTGDTYEWLVKVKNGESHAVWSKFHTVKPTVKVMDGIYTTETKEGRLFYWVIQDGKMSEDMNLERAKAKAKAGTSFRSLDHEWVSTTFRGINDRMTVPVLYEEPTGFDTLDKDVTYFLKDTNGDIDLLLRYSEARASWVYRWTKFAEKGGDWTKAGPIQEDIFVDGSGDWEKPVPYVEPKKGLHTFDKDKTYRIVMRGWEALWYEIKYDGSEWTMKTQNKYAPVHEIPLDEYESELYTGEHKSYHPPVVHEDNLSDLEKYEKAGLIGSRYRSGSLEYKVTKKGKVKGIYRDDELDDWTLVSWDFEKFQEYVDNGTLTKIS